MISIVLDTNLLFSNSTDFTKVQFIEKLQPIFEEMESNDLYEEVQILIPQLVIDELFIQQVAKYEEAFDKIKNNKLPNSEIKHESNYTKYLQNLYDNLIVELKGGFVKFEIIPNPDNDVLESIIKRSIQKEAPFEGTDKKSDKGFKDVIIWESLKKRKQTHATETIILFTKDGRMCEKSLSEEYYQRFRDELYIIKKEKDNLALYNKISELLNKEVKLTLSEKLNQKLLELCSEENIGNLFINNEFTDYEGEHICNSIEITDKQINTIDDNIENGRIKYIITIDLICGYKDDGIPKFSMLHKCNFDFEYCFYDDKFYLRRYYYVFGDCELISETFEID